MTDKSETILTIINQKRIGNMYIQKWKRIVHFFFHFRNIISNMSYFFHELCMQYKTLFNFNMSFGFY